MSESTSLESEGRAKRRVERAEGRGEGLRGKGEITN